MLFRTTADGRLIPDGIQADVIPQWNGMQGLFAALNVNASPSSGASSKADAPGKSASPTQAPLSLAQHTTSLLLNRPTQGANLSAGGSVYQPSAGGQGVDLHSAPAPVVLTKVGVNAAQAIGYSPPPPSIAQRGMHSTGGGGAAPPSDVSTGGPDAGYDSSMISPDNANNASPTPTATYINAQAQASAAAAGGGTASTVAIPSPSDLGFSTPAALPSDATQAAGAAGAVAASAVAAPSPASTGSSEALYVGAGAAALVAGIGLYLAFR